MTPAVIGAVVLLALGGGYYAMIPRPQPQAEVATTEEVAVAPPPTASPEADPAVVAREGEEALQLLPGDRQRIQGVLTSLGYDTRGSDGTFGQRSREMIAAWQKAKGHSATGFLTAAQVPALLRDAPPGPGARPSASPPAKAGSGAYDGVYGGGLSSSGFAGASGVVTAELSIAGGQLIGRVTQPGCGTSALSLTVSSNGEISGSGRIYENRDCSMGGFTATGKAAGDQLTIELRTPGGSVRGSLGRRGG